MDIRKYISPIFLFIFLYLFLIYNINFGGPDQPIYYAYTASLVDDGDLNVVNQAYRNTEQFSVSQTYNLPSYHNHGGVILWVPFYVYAKSVYFIANKFDLHGLLSYEFDDLAKCAMSFSTIFFGFLFLIFIYLFCRGFFSEKIALFSTLVFFLGTPFFYLNLFETGNANMIACLFSLFSICFCTSVVSVKNSHWFFYGLFFSIATAVKTEIWFQLPFILFLFVAFMMMEKITWKHGACFFAGIVPGFILKGINDYLKYGSLHIGEAGLFSFRNFYFFEQLFSSYRGFFYTSPIFYICLLGFILLSIRLLRNIKHIDGPVMDDLLFFILGLYVFIKIFILSFRYAWGGGTPGARTLLTDLPVFILLYARAFQTKRLWLKYLLGICSVIFVAWNLLVVSEYMTGIDLKYICGAPPLWIRFGALKDIFSQLLYVKDIGIKLKLCTPLLLVTFVTTSYIFRTAENSNRNLLQLNIVQNRPRNSKPFILFTAYLFIAYLIITALNVFYNQKNVEKLKQNAFFENADILAKKDYEKFENMSSFDEMIYYYTLTGNTNMVNRVKKQKRELYNE